MKFNSKFKINKNNFNFKLKNKIKYENKNLKIIEETKSVNLNDLKDLILINQVDNKYILCINKTNKKLLLFDQHAVHERIRYEYFIDLLFNNKSLLKSVFIKETKLCINTIKIINIFNQNFNDDVKINKIKLNIDKFKKINILFKEENNKLFLIKSIQIFGKIIEKNDILELIDDFSNNFLPKLINNLIMSFSCKRAIKYNNKLDYSVLNILIDDLKNLKNGLFCIHGRNSCINI